MIDENLLIYELQSGNPQAFSQLVSQAKDRVYNTSLGIVQNAEDAEDISQEVFIEVYRSVSSFKGDARLSTWLYRIAVTKSLDFLRHKKRKKRFAFVQSLFGGEDNTLQTDSTDFVHPGVLLENKERAAVLFKAIDKLPENQKAAYTLHKVEGLSYQEISDVLQTSLSSVESLMFRAKANLQKMLETYYKNEK